ncbi:hypothetical protein [Pseudaquabacterium rugosum]|uniref:Uncharacterized protein n=1 Tax=Pseudaquabacterium rugosum TaxID=2984194 RepID=A0ABU9B563_9BURK
MLADGAAAAVRAWAVQTVLDARECAARHQALARALHPPAGSGHPSGGAAAAAEHGANSF